MYVCSVASVRSDSLQPYRLQPARLLCSWDSPGKNIGVGCLPPPGDLPNPGMEPSSFMSPALAGKFFTTSATWEAPIHTHIYRIIQVLLYHDMK